MALAGGHGDPRERRRPVARHGGLHSVRRRADSRHRSLGAEGASALERAVDRQCREGCRQVGARRRDPRGRRGRRGHELKTMPLLRRRPQPPLPRAQLVCRWDLDKTYLKSEFDTLRDMVRIPFEKAEDKIAAPGVAALIRGLRESALSRGDVIRVYFVSASPPQIGRAIRRKLELDGIVYDGIVFKNQLQRLMRGKFRHLREQVGFKLTELLTARRAEPPAAREYLFGDDWESDPLIYSLYADIVAGRVDPDQLVDILRAVRVDAPLIDQARALAAAIEPVDAVPRIFINLERRTPPAQLRAYGDRLVPTFNYLQTAACLYA